MYLTDDVHLYELIEERVQRNFGRLGGHLRALFVRDCVSLDELVITGPGIAFLRPVQADLFREAA